MKIVITQQDAYEPPPLPAASATLPSIVAPGTAIKVSFNAQGLITSSAALDAADITTALGYPAYDAVTNPAGFVTAATGLPAIIAPGTASKVTFSAQGLITGAAALAAADITGALGFAPYNATANPAGFVGAAALAGYATSAELAAATSGMVASLTTTDATPTALPALPQPPSGLTAGRVVWCVTAQDAASGDVAIFDAIAGFKRAAPGAQLAFVGTPSLTPFAADASMTACTAAFGLGASLSMTVTGLAGRQIAWQVTELGAL